MFWESFLSQYTKLVRFIRNQQAFLRKAIKQQTTFSNIFQP